MKSNLSALILAGILGLLIVAIGLSFLFGIDNPVSWILILVLIAIPLLYRRITARGQMVWKEAYSVGVAALDEDHKKLIDLLNQFQTAYEYHTSDAFERRALNELIDYTKYHFQREEQLMEEHGYPDLERHKEKHQEMIAEVDRFVADYEIRGHAALADVAHYLMGWLITHINGTDKHYGPFLNRQGVN
ncbi:bacteriohemerythrin [Sedimenticola hydrogenitrophicus]|uniref:bacteriohemerythrin n=1 Tax=Sedimenticola hydrogenitrophicus TaxID=2967975 RepID=UPI0021A5E07E|nr:bacteriohemerythrin [Sedimenticola hydrogenitrophicus]